ncbi:MAG: hypothetical protein A2Y04_01780 [Omnitrophica WOR_2 bacterium GWC2_45_7]|nr:MAG: hypothetical protein A2Y04_01780 [Omnitrophica WOR_2 bacterium GWC2_45_7]
MLGEQSVKELRGSAMEDVIFNGTEKKPSLGFAEVSLTFSNEKRMLPIEYDEVTITRRLFRSGESEYLLNKTVVRLKDIQEMLMGTGIGAEAYSLIQQGKVDLVVSARPEDRRMILDEASGITKYKIKKKEALSKLKSTEENLLRVNDITVEVKRQIGSIERQANKARKYKEDFEKLKDLEVRVTRFQLRSFLDQKNRLAGQIKELKDKESKLGQERDDLGNLLTHEINYLGELEQKINETQAERIKVDGQLDLHQRQIEFNQERIENLQQNEKRLHEEKVQLLERCRVQQEKLEEIKKNLIVLEESARWNDQKLKEKKDSLHILERVIGEAKEKIKDHEDKTLTLTSTLVSVRNALTDIMKETQGALARKRRFEIEKEKVSSEKYEVAQRITHVLTQIGCLRETIQNLIYKKEHKERIIRELSSGLSQQEQAIHELEKKVLFAKSQKEFIEKLNVQYEDMPDPIIEGRLITQSVPLEHHTGIIGKVKGVLPINPERLENLKKDFARPDILRLYEIVCETKFIELDPQQMGAKIDELNREIQELMIQRAQIEEKLQEARRELQGIEQETQSKERTYSILEAQKEDIVKNEEKLVGELTLVDSELSEVIVSLSSMKKKEEELNFQLDTVNQDIGWCQNDIKDKQQWIAEKSQEREGVNVAVAQLETEITLSRDKLKSLQESHTHYCEMLDNWLDGIKKIDDEVVGQKLKVAQYELEIAAQIGKIEEMRLKKESLSEFLAEQEFQKTDLGQRINSVRVQMNALDDEMEKIKQDLHDQKFHEQEIVFNEKGIKDRLMQTYKINWEDVSVSAELDFYIGPNAKGAATPLREGTPTAVSVEQTGVEALAGIQPSKQIEDSPVEMTFEEMGGEVERLRKKCDAYGTVNLVAIEEYEELKQRFEFLTKQQADLFEAKSQLMSTIQKINRSTRQMFMDTFTKVSEEFRIYFRMLFGGGEAQLILLDPENVLESGIDIVARPPGKKLQNISLLSGGEKSLTAIALVFGVFKVNPSPFCVLDEIDAALDESNVGRFSYLLKDFAKIAQFIVITHNKKTISSADVMYGITMPETGVSRIVSVKFSEDKQRNEEPVAVGA